METFELKQQLNRIEAAALSQKNVLTFDEASRYIGVSKSDLYKRTSNREIPHFKPRGKMIYFDRVELENWLRTNPVKTLELIEKEANSYITFKKGRM